MQSVHVRSYVANADGKQEGRGKEKTCKDGRSLSSRRKRRDQGAFVPIRRGAVAWKHTRTMETVSCRVAADEGAWETLRGWKGKPVDLVRDKTKKKEGSDGCMEGEDRPSWIHANPEMEWNQNHPMVRQLCESDAHAKSWRKKLEALNGAVEETTRNAATDPHHEREVCQEDVIEREEDRWTRTTEHPSDGQEPESYLEGAERDLEATACANLYLSWMARGLVPCMDADGHHRPNHHARISKELFAMVEAMEARSRARVRAMAPCTGRELHPSHDVGLEGTLARRVSARLPAFDARFTHAEPLTRIRDIAHGKGADGRCEEVRKEIKHTIQNKLHRACGPEDLVASAKMLAKLTAEGADYPQAFVDEFRIFFRELKDFFGASGLRDVLDALCPHLEVEGIRRVESLRRALDGWKEWEDARTGLASSEGEDTLVEPEDPADSDQEHSVDGRGFAHALQVARQASDLRRMLLDALSGEEPPTAEDGKEREESTCTVRYAMRMADARLEELAFVKLSTACTFLESAGSWLSDGRERTGFRGENGTANSFRASGWNDLLCLEIQALIVGMDHVAFLPHLEIPGRSIAKECARMLEQVPGWNSDDSWEALVERTDRLFGAPMPPTSPDQPIPPSVPTVQRAKSLFQKARSLSARHADQLEKVLVPRAMLFAKGLRNADSAGLLEESTKVHEAEVRSDAGFAVARLADAGLAALRGLRRVAADSKNGNEVWDAVVMGASFGQLDVVETPEDGWKINGHGPLGHDSARKGLSTLDHDRRWDPNRSHSRSNGREKMPGKILLLRSATGDEDIGTEVRGILLRHPIPHLSHLALRARQQRVPMAAADDPCSWDTLAALPSGLQVELSVSEEGMVSVLEAKEGAEQTEGSPILSIGMERDGNEDIESLLGSSEVVESSVQAGLRIHLMEQETDPIVVSHLAGAKAGHCFALQELSKRLEGTEQGTPFRVPKSAFFPRGSMESHLQQIGLMASYRDLLQKLEDACERVVVEGPLDHGQDLRTASALLRDFLSRNAIVPDSALHPLVQAFGGGAILMVRSSATDEDMPGASAAGLYDSVPALVEGVRGDSTQETGPSNGGLASSIARVWSSLYSDRAVNNRVRTSGIQQVVQMGVLFQELVHPKICFVMMTKDPFRKDPSSAYIELARGHGEVLASASIPGVPVRLRLSKNPGRIEHSLLSLESYNVQLMVGRDGRLREEWSQDNSRHDGDWSAVLQDVVPKLHALCLSIEKEFEEPQDIEGCITKEGHVVVFQTRVQP